MEKTTLAVLGGSRAYDLLRKHAFGEEELITQPDTPFGKAAPVRKFAGKGFSFYFISRHGEKGYAITAPYINYRANLWALKELGVERVLSWSQPGSMDPALPPGAFTVPHDIIDMTHGRRSTFYENSGFGFVRMDEPFCPRVRDASFQGVIEAGRECGDSGVYVCTQGPRLETPAEIRMFSLWGGTLVGMTLATEAFLARELEMCYGSVCLISNYAEGIKERAFKEGELFEGMLSGDESEKVEGSLNLLPEIAEKTLKRLAGTERTCNCGKAMERYRRSGRMGPDLLEEILKLRG